MLTETVLSTIVQVSITGGGLVLAIYAIVIPFSKKMFTQRVEQLLNQSHQFEKYCQELKPENSDKRLKKLEEISQDIKEKRLFQDI